ncbi:MAG TPA: hypothetical protein VIT23_10585, partial [Terrimicrobiaceae bacterium]
SHTEGSSRKALHGMFQRQLLLTLKMAVAGWILPLERTLAQPEAAIWLRPTPANSDSTPRDRVKEAVLQTNFCSFRMSYEIIIGAMVFGVTAERIMFSVVMAFVLL